MSKKLNYQLGIEIINKLNQADSLSKINYILANETWHLFSQFQTVILSINQLEKFKVETISSLIEPNGQSSFCLWVEKLAEDIVKNQDIKDKGCIVLNTDNFIGFVKENWHDYWPHNMLVIPFVDNNNKCIGMALATREQPFTEEECGLFFNIVKTANNRYLSFDKNWRSKFKITKKVKYVLIALGIISLIPTKISVNAPGEIISLNSKTVSSPIEGTIKEFNVKQNEYVKKDDVLFSLDAELLQSKLEIAQNAYKAASADLLSAQQRALVSEESKAEISMLEAKASEKRSELNQALMALEYTKVRALDSGYFIYSDENEWIGKPIVIGEKIGQIAPKENLAVKIYLPADNAIKIKKGDEVSLSLNVAPLSSIKGEIDTVSFAASLSPDNIVSYKLRAKIEDNDDARIGYRANVKIYGDRYPIIYQILRRPIGYIRLWLGI